MLVCLAWYCRCTVSFAAVATALSTENAVAEPAPGDQPAVPVESALGTAQPTPAEGTDPNITAVNSLGEAPPADGAAAPKKGKKKSGKKGSKKGTRKGKKKGSAVDATDASSGMFLLTST